jgi:hypothetical protein
VEGVRAEPAPDHDGGEGEQYQVGSDHGQFVPAGMSDGRSDHEEHQTGGGQWHQYWGDAGGGRNDEPDGGQYLERADELDAGRAEVVGPGHAASR